MTLDLHVLDIGTQFPPQMVDHRQRCRIGLIQRRQNHLVASKQLGIGGFHPALLGTGNRVPRHEAYRFAGKGQASGAHHIAFGAADVGDDCITQVELGQAGQEVGAPCGEGSGGNGHGVIVHGRSKNQGFTLEFLTLPG